MPENDLLWNEAIWNPEHIEWNTGQVDRITDEIKNCLKCLLFSQCFWNNIVPTPACGSVYDKLQKNKFY